MEIFKDNVYLTIEDDDFSVYAAKGFKKVSSRKAIEPIEEIIEEPIEDEGEKPRSRRIK